MAAGKKVLGEAIDILTPAKQLDVERSAAARRALVDRPEAEPLEPLGAAAKDRPTYHLSPKLEKALPDANNSQAHLFTPGVQDMFEVMQKNPGANGEYVGYITPRQYKRFIANTEDPLVSKTKAQRHGNNVVDGRGISEFVVIEGEMAQDGTLLFDRTAGGSVMRMLQTSDDIDVPVPVIFKITDEHGGVLPINFAGLEVEETAMFDIPFFREARAAHVRTARKDPFVFSPEDFQARNTEEYVDIAREMFSPERAAYQRTVNVASNQVEFIDELDAATVIKEEILASRKVGGTATSRVESYEKSLELIEAGHDQALRAMDDMRRMVFHADRASPTATAQLLNRKGTVYTRELFGDKNPATKDLPMQWFRMERQQAGAPKRALMRDKDGNFVSDIFPLETGTHWAGSQAQANFFKALAPSQARSIKLFEKQIKQFEEAFGGELGIKRLSGMIGDSYSESVTFSEMGSKLRADFSPVAFEEALVGKLQLAGVLDKTVDVGIARVWAANLALAHKGVSKHVERQAVFMGKQGYLTQDLGHFTPGAVANTLLQDSQFSKHTNELEIIRRGAQSGAENNPDFRDLTKRLYSVMEAEGYDHILYINQVENAGIPSMVSWRPDLMQELSRRPVGGFSLEDYERMVTAVAGMAIGGTLIQGDKKNATDTGS